MQKIILSFLLLLAVSAIAFSWLSFSITNKKILVNNGAEVVIDRKAPSREFLKLQKKGVTAKAFARRNRFDTAFCFLIDMSLPANRKRFFIYDLKKDTLLNSGLVTHGNCNQYWLEGRKYGNEIGCGCTSLGKYKIGNSYYGRFGLAFKLYGLDSSNSNAFKRFVVLHSHSCVPEEEVEAEVCQSNGCPTVAPSFLKNLSGIITKSKKPVLLWIFE